MIAITETGYEVLTLRENEKIIWNLIYNFKINLIKSFLKALECFF